MKYKALIKHWLRGNCTFSEMRLAIKVLEGLKQD